MIFASALDLYEIVQKACYRNGEHMGHGNKIVFISLSHNNIGWIERKLFVKFTGDSCSYETPHKSYIIESDFWKGYKYLKLHWIVDIDSIKVNEGYGVYGGGSYNE